MTLSLTKDQGNLNKGLYIQVGDIKGILFGGPFAAYRKGQRRLVGIKLATEQKNPADFIVPSHDFAVPKVEDMSKGIIFALESMHRGEDVYAGCGAGQGRTGTFMACFIKCVQDYELSTGSMGITHEDPVLFVRKNYLEVAVETREQEAYARGFDSSTVLVWLDNNAVRKPVVQTEIVVEKVPVYLNPWQSFLHSFWGIMPRN